jgi:hypothetical protein
MESDPDGQRGRGPTAILGGDSLLDGYGTGQRVNGAREDGHESVAQVLHLVAAAGTKGLAKYGEIRSANLLGGFLTQPVEKFGRPDEVREQ